MTDKELDDLFQKSMAGHQMPVPPDMWQRVNPQKDKRRRAAFFWWSGLGIAALLMLTGTAVWIYHTSQENTTLTAAKREAPQQPADSAANETESTTTAAGGISQSHSQSSTDNQNSSFQTSGQPKSQSNQKTPDFYHSRQQFYRDQQKAVPGIVYGHQSEVLPETKRIVINGQAGSQVNGQSNSQLENFQGNINNKQGNANSETAITLNETDSNTQANSSATSAQKLDSNLAVITKIAEQKSKSAAIKVKKIHGEKVPGIELMIAGYGNSRHVYDASRFSTSGLVAFGPVNTKEKVLMQSFSINARIDKPLARNISVKTGIQFLQTHQRVSYTYETVNQFSFVNVSSNDTTISARLQSKESVVRGVYNSLSVPVLVSYRTNGAKLNVGATAGIMLNVLSWYGGRVPGAGGSGVLIAKNTFRSHTGTSLYAGITVSRQLGGFQLFAEPHIQYTLSSVTKSRASFRQKITGYGLGIGIRKPIGK